MYYIILTSSSYILGGSPVNFSSSHHMSVERFDCNDPVNGSGKSPKEGIKENENR